VLGRGEWETWKAEQGRSLQVGATMHNKRWLSINRWVLIPRSNPSG
jgi:hypothetical protein